MSNAKAIKNRISSVNDTAKITNAMYLISSVKLRKAKEELSKTYPYFNFLRDKAEKILSHINFIESKYFLPEGVSEEEHEANIDGKTAIFCITSDKGLAGAYNLSVIKETLDIIERVDDYSLYVVGNYGRTYFKNHNYNIEESFLFDDEKPSMDMARDITSVLLEQYNKGIINRIYIVYTEYGNALNSKAISFRMLPFHRSYFEKNKTYTNSEDYFEIVPSPNEVIDTIAQNYFLGYVYSGLVDSYCSEQNDRMIAMDNANNNAKELIDELNLKFNHLRQNVITKEITEISSGAKSLKR